MRRSLTLLPLLVTLAIMASALPAAARSDIAIGWTVEGDGHDKAWVMAQVDAYIADVGEKPRIWGIWSKWGDRKGDSNGPCPTDRGSCRFPTETVKALHARGITPMIWWVYVDPKDPYGNRNFGQYARIINHHHDAYIKQWAKAARDVGRETGGKTIIRFGHESDGTWFAWSTSLYQNTPTKFQKAWRQIWKKFNKVDAIPHVRFLWSQIKPRANHYPGDRYVDFVGLTLLNPGTTEGDPWKRAKDVLDGKVSKARKVTKKPIIGAEIGSGHGGGDKGEWVRQLYTRAYYKHPYVKGLVYLNANRGPDWRLHVGDSGAGLIAYSKLAKLQQFKGTIK